MFPSLALRSLLFATAPSGAFLLEIGMKALRHRCRNPHCRMKLPEPVENEHHAFCTRACYESFYLTRCRVCERDLRKRDKETGKPRLVQAGRLYCRPPNKCRLEASKHVSRYDWGGGSAPQSTPLRSGHSTGLKTGIRGPRRILDIEVWAKRSMRHGEWSSLRLSAVFPFRP